MEEGLLKPTEVIAFDEEKYQKNLKENTFAPDDNGKGEDK